MFSGFELSVAPSKFLPVATAPIEVDGELRQVGAISLLQIPQGDSSSLFPQSLHLRRQDDAVFNLVEFRFWTLRPQEDMTFSVVAERTDGFLR